MFDSFFKLLNIKLITKQLNFIAERKRQESFNHANTKAI